MALFYVCTVNAAKRLTVFIFLITTIVCLSLKYVPSKKHAPLPINPLACYRIKNETLPEFSGVNPKKEKSMYFFDTSCVSYEYGKIKITQHHACSVESAARTNPNTDIYVLFTSPGLIKNGGTTSDRLLKTLLTYPNVKIHHLDLEMYVKNTPLEDFFRNRTIESSKFPVQHVGDALRYLTLWKYGGTYVNFDLLILKSLENLPPNYIGMPLSFLPYTSVLNLAPKGKSRYYANMFLSNFVNSFRGDNLLHNGPGVLVRSLQKICKAKPLTEKALRECKGFNVYSSNNFYPVPWWDYYKLFLTEYNDEILNMTENGYIVQLWNHHVYITPVTVKNSNIPYIQLIKKYCPKVYAETEFF